MTANVLFYLKDTKEFVVRAYQIKYYKALGTYNYYRLYEKSVDRTDALYIHKMAGLVKYKEIDIVKFFCSPVFLGVFKNNKKNNFRKNLEFFYFK